MTPATQCRSSRWQEPSWVDRRGHVTVATARYDLVPVRRERSDDAAWKLQRKAQERLSPEQRILQNEALVRLWLEATKPDSRPVG